MYIVRSLGLGLTRERVCVDMWFFMKFLKHHLTNHWKMLNSHDPKERQTQKAPENRLGLDE
jgi:hypothetical protein